LQAYFQTQSSLQTLLQTSAIVVFEFSEQDISEYIQLKTLDELKQVAKQNRPDFLLMQQNKTLATQFLKYQKRVVVPDVNLFVSYDQRGGAFNNQMNAGISVPLPIWNRNQGNIKSAEWKVKETDYQLQAMEIQLESE